MFFAVEILVDHGILGPLLQNLVTLGAFETVRVIVKVLAAFNVVVNDEGVTAVAEEPVPALPRAVQFVVDEVNFVRDDVFAGFAAEARFVKDYLASITLCILNEEDIFADDCFLALETGHLETLGGVFLFFPIFLLCCYPFD